MIQTPSLLTILAITDSHDPLVAYLRTRPLLQVSMLSDLFYCISPRDTFIPRPDRAEADCVSYFLMLAAIVASSYACILRYILDAAHCPSTETMVYD